MKTIKNIFTSKLLLWNEKDNTRAMPWKGEKDPYKIWLSEVILQQTRVEQGWAYYEKFIKAFPEVHDLAEAPEKKVFKLWEGLGYYNRCKNLIVTAKIISGQYHGVFPATYEEIRGLKGIGPYTAAAIASFAFNLPHAVVDGNVERVLARYFGSDIPVDTTEGKKFYTGLAGELLDKKQAGRYNQAIMDFGAVICKPKNPLCMQCALQQECKAYQKNEVALFPVKKKAIEKKNRWLCYFIVELNDQVYIRLRTAKDIWQNLYEFVLWETAALPAEENVMQSAFVKETFHGQQVVVKSISPVYKQQLTHQTIYGRFIVVVVKRKTPALQEYLLVNRKDVGQYPFPRFIAGYLQESAKAQVLF